MKKIWLAIMAIGTCAMFSACEQNGNENSDNSCPVTELSVPGTAEIGAEISVRGEGFDEASAKLFFRDSGNNETAVENPAFSASGVSFKIPVTLEPGKYMLVLEQEGKWELGEISLTEAKLPVTDITLPEYGGTGKEITIGGSGFDASSELFIENSEGDRTGLEISDRSAGLTASIPETAVKGVYKLILGMNGLEWTLSDSFEIFKSKTLSSAAFTTSMSMAAEGMIVVMEGTTTWKPQFSGDQLTALVSEDNSYMAYKDAASGTVLMEDSQSVTTTYTATLSGNTYSFSGEMSAETGSLPEPFSLTVSDGRVISNTLERENGYNGDYNWGYDEDGHLQSLYVNNPDSPYAKFTYENGNLVNYLASGGASFRYGETPATKPNPYCLDAASCIMASDGTLETFQIAALLLGWTGKGSSLFPACSVSSDWDGNEVETPFEYEFDEDNYVKSIKWSVEMMGDFEITLIYE